MSTTDTLPDYASQLLDFHRAFAHELRAMIAGLPIRPGDNVLEMACGDGAYARWLSEHVEPGGSVAALDVSTAFLELARETNDAEAVAFVGGTLENPPFSEGTFDLVWCAQSLYSLPEPVEALRRMARLVKPGGTLAVLENDTLHHVLLPWPIEVELAVRVAELEAHAEESKRPRKFYVGRQLREMLRQAGLERTHKRTWATNRSAPLTPDERGFFEKYIDVLRRRALPYLAEDIRERFDPLSDPASPSYILDDPDLTVTCIDHVVTGVKPDSVEFDNPIPSRV